MLLRRVTPISPNTSNENTLALFNSNEDLMVLPVVDREQRPIGIINRLQLTDRFSRSYFHEIYGRKPCTEFMVTDPVIVDKNTSVQDLGSLLSSVSAWQLLNGFIVTDGGRYLGIGTTQDLLRVITDMQIGAARHANPLTGLPGNVPIHDEIDKRLARNAWFCLAYVDLDHFKPFNDVYGFAKGDEVIALTGRILADIADPVMDFVGHVGGDDFVVLFASADWEQRCTRALKYFEVGIRAFFHAEDLARRGYETENRKGEKEFHALTAMSIGAVEAEPGRFRNRHELITVSAEAKKKAKSLPGNTLHINQRRY